MIWSILICTLESRRELFNKLNSDLVLQIKDNDLEDKVEILFFEDDRDYPVGAKRNTLIEAATGKYISFIDDDDTVSDSYVKKIYDAIKNCDVDCVGIKGLLVGEISLSKEFIHSLKYKEYSEDNRYYYRPPNHLNVIKKEKIKNFKFPIKNFGEDFDWAMKICNSGVLKTEVFIDDVLYYYHFDYEKTETQKRGIV